MTKPPTPAVWLVTMTIKDLAPQNWDAAPNEIKIEWLAVNVMGWEVNEMWNKNGDRGICFLLGDGTIRTSLFSPLTDWNHWREVEEKIMENGLNHMRFKEEFGYNNVFGYMKADLPTRCKAAFLATHE